MREKINRLFLATPPSSHPVQGLEGGQGIHTTRETTIQKQDRHILDRSQSLTVVMEHEEDVDEAPEVVQGQGGGVECG